MPLKSFYNPRATYSRMARELENALTVARAIKRSVTIKEAHYLAIGLEANIAPLVQPTPRMKATPMKKKIK